MLSFHYGVMGSGKSEALIRQYNSFISWGYSLNKIIAFTMNDRECEKITSRSGKSIDAVSIYDHTDIYYDLEGLGFAVVLFDEVQFYTVAQVEQMLELSNQDNVHVEAYGLKDDFRNELFPASKRLFELADKIFEIRGPDCYNCGTTAAVVNARFIDGVIQRSGPIVLVDNSSTVEYHSLCRRCYSGEIGIGNEPAPNVG